MSAGQTNEPAELHLTIQDRQSQCWGKVRAYLEGRIDEHRRNNDNDLTPEKTAHTRGRIAELKALLLAAEPSTE